MTRTFTFDETLGDRVERLAAAIGWTPLQLVERQVRQVVDPDAPDPAPMPNLGRDRHLRAGAVPLRTDIPGTTAARLVVAAADAGVGVGPIAAFVLAGATPEVVRLAADRAAAVRDPDGRKRLSKLNQVAREANAAEQVTGDPSGSDATRPSLRAEDGLRHPAPQARRIDASSDEVVPGDDRG